jgi:hypothetical protein
VSIARWNLKEAEDDSADATNRNQIEGCTELGNPATDGEARKPNGAQGSKSGAARTKGVCLTLGDLSVCLGNQTIVLVTVREGQGGVSRGHSSQREADEGPNPLQRGAVGDSR